MNHLSEYNSTESGLVLYWVPREHVVEFDDARDPLDVVGMKHGVARGLEVPVQLEFSPIVENDDVPSCRS